MVRFRENAGAHVYGHAPLLLLLLLGLELVCGEGWIQSKCTPGARSGAGGGHCWQGGSAVVSGVHGGLYSPRRAQGTAHERQSVEMRS